MILVLEASTASAKAMVYNPGEGMVRLVSEAYPFEDLRVQNPNEVFNSVIEAGKSCAFGFDITSIAVVGTWHSLIALDKDMNPVSKAYTWAYTEASGKAKILRKDEDFTKHMYTQTGCMPHAMYPAVKIPHLREEGLIPEDCLFTEQGSYIFYKLTDERKSSLSLLSGSGLLSLHKTDFDEDMLKFSGVDSSQFGNFASFNDTSPLSNEGARLLGLKQGIPVLPAMPDGGMNQVGAGASSEGIMTISVGTSAALRISTPKPVTLPDRSAWCYRGAKGFLCGAAINGSTNCVDWIKDSVFSGHYSYKELDNSLQPGKDAPIFLPFIFGERCPGWNDDAKGGFIGLSAFHTYKDLYYAVLEGVLFNIAQCYRAIEKAVGAPKEIRVSGGIAKASVWLQMLADILNKRILVSENSQASLLGGVCLALNIETGAEIEDFLSPHEISLEPDTKTQDYYETRFGAYIKAYEDLER